MLKKLTTTLIIMIMIVCPNNGNTQTEENIPEEQENSILENLENDSILVKARPDSILLLDIIENDSVLLREKPDSILLKESSLIPTLKDSTRLEGEVTEVIPNLLLHNEMVSVSSGLCLIGNLPAGYASANLYDKPVFIASFRIDKTEVSNSDYTLFLNDGNDIHFHPEMHIRKGETGNFKVVEEFSNHPVTYVNWFDAMAFARWAGKRLPTEEEWEKAARGISKSPGVIRNVGVGQIYPWGNSAPDSTRANFWMVSHPFLWTTPVGWYDSSKHSELQTRSNASMYGALDMAGNVWEWTISEYRTPEVGAPPEGIDSLRVIRGGGWCDPPDNIRTTSRTYRNILTKSSQLGFRCADGLDD